MLTLVRDRWSAHACVILSLLALALATLTCVTCRTTVSEFLLAPFVATLATTSSGTATYRSASPIWTCNIKASLQLLLDWCNVQFKPEAFQSSHSFAVQSWCVLISTCAPVIHALVCLRAPWGRRLTSQLKTHASSVLVSGWVKIVGASRHAFAYLIEQKVWLAMRPPSGMDRACLSLCVLCIVLALVLYRLYCLRKLRATLGIRHPPAQASSTLPSKPLDLDSAKLDAETLPEPHKGEEHQQKEVADTVDATSKLDASQMEKATKLTKKQRRAARAAASATKNPEQPEQQPDEKTSGQSGEELWQKVTRRRRLPKPSSSPSAEASLVDAAVTSNCDMAGSNGLRSAKPSSASNSRRIARADPKQPIHKVATTPKSIRSWVNSQQGSAASALQPLTVSAVGQSSVHSISDSDADQEWPPLSAAVSSANSQAPVQMSRLSSAPASASPEVPAPLVTAQVAPDDEDSSSHVAADSAVATGISAEQPLLTSSSSAASVPAEGVCVDHEKSTISSAPAASGAGAVSAGMNMIPSGNRSAVSAATLELQPSSPSTAQPASQAAFPGSIFASSSSIDSPASSSTFEAADCRALSASDRDVSVPTCARAAVFGTFPDSRGAHTSLFLQQSGYLMTPMLGGTCNFKC